MKLKKEQLLGIVRHTLTFFGGIIITKGYIDEQTLTETVGAILTLTGVVWSYFEKKRLN